MGRKLRWMWVYAGFLLCNTLEFSIRDRRIGNWDRRADFSSAVTGACGTILVLTFGFCAIETIDH